MPNGRKAVLCFVTMTSAIVFVIQFNRQTSVLTEGFIDTKLKSVYYSAILSNLNKARVAADDKMLVRVLREYYIESPAVMPYSLSNPKKENPSPGQTQFVDKLLGYMKYGFFVDCGAFDGELLSNSLFLERYRNWTGVLIEPNPLTYDRLKGKNRKAHTLNACLSTKPFPVSEMFVVEGKAARSRIMTLYLSAKDKMGDYVIVQCFPLYSVLLALNRLHVDYFSLDVEGAELGVLETIPWNRIDIKVISIEHNKWKGGKGNLTEYMQLKGYELLSEIRANAAPDLIFMKRDI